MKEVCKICVYTVIIVLLGILVCMHISDCVIRDTNIVLTFVGILWLWGIMCNQKKQKKSLETKWKNISKKTKSKKSC